MLEEPSTVVDVRGGHWPPHGRPCHHPYRQPSIFVRNKGLPTLAVFRDATAEKRQPGQSRETSGNDNKEVSARMAISPTRMDQLPALSDSGEAFSLARVLADFRATTRIRR